MLYIIHPEGEKQKCSASSHRTSTQRSIYPKSGRWPLVDQRSYALDMVVGNQSTIALVANRLSVQQLQPPCNQNLQKWSATGHKEDLRRSQDGRQSQNDRKRTLAECDWGLSKQIMSRAWRRRCASVERHSTFNSTLVPAQRRRAHLVLVYIRVHITVGAQWKGHGTTLMYLNDVVECYLVSNTSPICYHYTGWPFCVPSAYLHVPSVPTVYLVCT